MLPSKKTDKVLFKEQIAKQDEMTYLVSENIETEARILRHLTAYNNIQSQKIIKYIDFFEGDNYFYLVTEYVEDSINLTKFIEKAHKLIADGQLSFNVYSEIVKSIMFQIAVTMQWLHDVVHCCHLDLVLENVLLQNADFIKQSDGSLKGNEAISIKLCDFGVSHLCALIMNPSSFQIRKYGLTVDNESLTSPQVYNLQKYDCRSADIWSFGMILWQCMVGEPLFEPEDVFQKTESGYTAICVGSLKEYMTKTNLLKYFDSGALSLLLHSLQYEENKRLNASQVIQHEWFKTK